MTPGERGYSLIELMAVVSVIGILGAMATLQIGAVRPGYQADGAMRVVIAELNVAREIAVAQRRSVEVEFVGVDTLRVTRIDDATADPDETTLLRTVSFEAGVQLGDVADSGDTPDAFGGDTANPASVTFNSDGQALDSDGSPVNYTIYLAIPSQPQTLRAVTVLGSTGRVRGYRWTGGSTWMRV